MNTKRPPLGWNSWNTFGNDISEELLMQTADAMIEKGLKDAGYEYVVIDDCWSLPERDENGDIVTDPKKFPHGMKYLADYIHSKGLKFGMDSCAGVKTCAGYPSSYHNEFRDAKLFASFDVDFLKYDFCNVPQGANGPLLYHTMGLALKESGKDILFSACNWGSDHVETWIRSCGAGMYRSTGDINDNFNSVRDIALSQVDKLAYSGVGCYNDIDMLIVGMYNRGNVKNGGCTDTDYKTHFSVWSFFASPLMIGCDIRSINDVTLELLKNKGLLRINQDEECRTAFVCGDNGNKGLVFFRHLSDNEYGLMFVNFADEEATLSLDLTNIGLWDGCGHGLAIKDVFDGSECKIERTLDMKLAAHDSKVYICKTISL